MPRSSCKKRTAPSGKRASAAAVRPRALPPPESIIAVEEFTSPKSGKTYLAIETNEMDAYDKVKKVKSKKAKSTQKSRGKGN